MEINRFDDVLGVKTQQAIVEGRFVSLCAQTISGLYMNIDADLPGVRLPVDAEDARRAKFCVTFAVDNRETPIVDYPNTSYDFRGGWVNSTQGPLTGVTMWLTPPGNQEGQTIPSGYKALAFTEATVTLPSGHYVDSADIRVPGAAIVVSNVADHGAGVAGMPRYAAAMAAGVIGFTQTYDAHDGRLTVRIE